jgi:hypothetical protein
VKGAAQEIRRGTIRWRRVIAASRDAGGTENSNTAANSLAKQTVGGSRIAHSTKNIGVPDATRPRTSPYDTAITIGACVR